MARLVHIVVIGMVQGVGFRYFTFKKARELGVKGFVKNLPDGTVEIEVTGDSDKLDRLIEAVQVGPRSAVVNDTVISWDTVGKNVYDQFRIEY